MIFFVICFGKLVFLGLTLGGTVKGDPVKVNGYELLEEIVFGSDILSLGNN